MIKISYGIRLLEQSGTAGNHLPLDLVNSWHLLDQIILLDTEDLDLQLVL